MREESFPRSRALAVRLESDTVLKSDRSPVFSDDEIAGAQNASVRGVFRRFTVSNRNSGPVLLPAVWLSVRAAQVCQKLHSLRVLQFSVIFTDRQTCLLQTPTLSFMVGSFFPE